MAALRRWTVIKIIFDNNRKAIIAGYAQETTAWFRTANMPAQFCRDDFVKKVQKVERKRSGFHQKPRWWS
ncbi:hypothetical protein GJ744_007523 [Endocarpon pusillum]|uniref:Uncharacterized protein n=1 Tax=Endocarpon pusillum TaxID=364733 RepID=A0A8H7E534_9EURO|nr:hypothetical protein GJ744_007523 [Endocarpon pusillum]